MCIYEAEEICNRVAFLDKGNIIAVDTPQNFKKLSKHGIFIEILVSFMHEDIISQLQSLPGVRNVSTPEKHEISGETPAEGIVVTIDEEKVIPEIMSALTESHTKVLSMNVREPSLEDIFIEMTGD
ncbi:MAG: hypothetical protein AYK18_00705 [Theionarchaea archaeon DG-70]|nr:MAG: hypothetical protein AYK18_00705 [Theionarchaea archaeon DG-70]